MGSEGFLKLLAQYLLAAQQNANAGGDAGTMSAAGGAAMRQAPVGMGGNNDYIRAYGGPGGFDAPTPGSGAYGMGGVGMAQMQQAPVGPGGNNDYMRAYGGPGGTDVPPAGGGAYGMGDVAQQQLLRLLMSLR